MYRFKSICTATARLVKGDGVGLIDCVRIVQQASPGVDCMHAGSPTSAAATHACTGEYNTAHAPALAPTPAPGPHSSKHTHTHAHSPRERAEGPQAGYPYGFHEHDRRQQGHQQGHGEGGQGQAGQEVGEVVEPLGVGPQLALGMDRHTEQDTVNGACG